MEYSLGLYEKALPENMSFAEILTSVQDYGFDHLEISIDESEKRLARLDWTCCEREKVRRAISSTGVPIKTMCLSGHRCAPLGSHDPAIRARSMEIMYKAIELSCDIGVRIIQLAGYDVYYEKGDEETRSWFFENLCRSAEMAAKAGMLLGFETMETSFMDTVSKAMKYVKWVNSPYLGVYPDIGNLKNASVLYGSDLLADICLGKGHIFAVHLKETMPGVYRNMRFGKGHTEYVPCIKVLYDMGVRMFTGEFWYLQEPNYRETLKAASTFLRLQLKAATDNERMPN